MKQILIVQVDDMEVTLVARWTNQNLTPHTYSKIDELARWTNDRVPCGMHFKVDDMGKVDMYRDIAMS